MTDEKEGASASSFIPHPSSLSSSGQSRFPVGQAFGFAVQGIRLRLGRMLLVLAGVAIAIAFTNVLLTSNQLFDALGAKMEAGQGMTRVPVFRWLWMAVSLVICTAGVFNAVVMSVTERVKEIGTLKCLGGRNIHIMLIFLFEALLIGAMGGVTGGVIGYLLAVLTFLGSVGSNYLTAKMLVGSTINILVCFAISTVISLLASIIPVWLATRIEAAEAMRYEV